MTYKWIEALSMEEVKLSEECLEVLLTITKLLTTHLLDFLHSKEEVSQSEEVETTRTQLHLKLKLLETECPRLVVNTLTLLLQLTNKDPSLEASKPSRAKAIL